MLERRGYSAQRACSRACRCRRRGASRDRSHVIGSRTGRETDSGGIKATKMDKVGVLGGGLLGHGIAQVAGQTGHEVVVREVDEQTLAKGVGKIEKQLARAVEK